MWSAPCRKSPANLITVPLIFLPILNLTTARAGMGTSVNGTFGFRPTRALRTLAEHVTRAENRHR